MANFQLIQKLDEKLMGNGIIDKLYKSDFIIVHKKLNTIIKKTGKILSENTFKKGDLALRKWLMVMFRKGASQEKLTSYLRCGLAHLSFDFIESSYRQISAEDLIARTLVSFTKRKFNTTFFKAAQVTKKKTPKRGVKKSKKKTVKKKQVRAIKKKKTRARNKTSVKKIAKKKTGRKKTAAKKKRKSVKSKRGLKTRIFRGIKKLLR